MDNAVKQALEKEWEVHQLALLQARTETEEGIKAELLNTLSHVSGGIKSQLPTMPLTEKFEQIATLSGERQEYQLAALRRAMKELTRRSQNGVSDPARMSLTSRQELARREAVAGFARGQGLDGINRDEWIAAQAAARLSDKGLAPAPEAVTIPADKQQAITADRAARIENYVNTIIADAAQLKITAQSDPAAIADYELSVRNWENTTARLEQTDFRGRENIELPDLPFAPTQESRISAGEVKALLAIEARAEAYEDLVDQVGERHAQSQLTHELASNWVDADRSDTASLRTEAFIAEANEATRNSGRAEADRLAVRESPTPLNFTHNGEAVSLNLDHLTAQPQAVVEPVAVEPTSGPAPLTFTHNGEPASLGLDQQARRLNNEIQFQTDAISSAQSALQMQQDERVRAADREPEYLAGIDSNIARLQTQINDATALKQAAVDSLQQNTTSQIQPPQEAPAPLNFTHNGEAASLNLDHLTAQPQVAAEPAAIEPRVAPAPLSFTHNGEPASLGFETQARELNVAKLQNEIQVQIESISSAQRALQMHEDERERAANREPEYLAQVNSEIGRLQTRINEATALKQAAVEALQRNVDEQGQLGAVDSTADAADSFIVQQHNRMISNFAGIDQHVLMSEPVFAAERGDFHAAQIVTQSDTSEAGRKLVADLMKYEAYRAAFKETAVNLPANTPEKFRADLQPGVVVAADLIRSAEAQYGIAKGKQPEEAPMDAVELEALRVKYGSRVYLKDVFENDEKVSRKYFEGEVKLVEVFDQKFGSLGTVPASFEEAFDHAVKVIDQRERALAEARSTVEQPLGASTETQTSVGVSEEVAATPVAKEAVAVEPTDAVQASFSDELEPVASAPSPQLAAAEPAAFSDDLEPEPVASAPVAQSVAAEPAAFSDDLEPEPVASAPVAQSVAAEPAAFSDDLEPEPVTSAPVAQSVAAEPAAFSDDQDFATAEPALEELRERYAHRVDLQGKQAADGVVFSAYDKDFSDDPDKGLITDVQSSSYDEALDRAVRSIYEKEQRLEQEVAAQTAQNSIAGEEKLEKVVLDQRTLDLLANARQADREAAADRLNFTAEDQRPSVRIPRGQNQVESDEVLTARQPHQTATDKSNKALVPDDVANLYLKVDNRYYHAKNTKVEAFVDKGNRLETRSNAEQIASNLVKIAEARGWSEIKVTGTETFRKEVWMTAAARGMHVKGYTPSAVDKAELASLLNKTEANKVEKATSEAKQQPARAAQSQSRTAANEAPPITNASTAQSATPAATPQRGAVRNPPQATTPAALELVAHGAAKYLFDEKNSGSYYVTTKDAAGELSTTWGTDLKRAVAEAGAKPGDKIHIQHEGNQQVIVPVAVRNEKGEVVSTENKEVKRNTWNVTMAEAFREKTPADVVKQYPQLAGAVATLAAIDKKAEHDGLSVEQRKVVSLRARENVAQAIEKGQIPDMKVLQEKELKATSKKVEEKQTAKEQSR